MTLAPPDDARADGRLVRGCVIVAPSGTDLPETLADLAGSGTDCFGFRLTLDDAAATHLGLTGQEPARLAAADLGLDAGPSRLRPAGPFPTAPDLAQDARDAAADALLRARSMVERVDAEIGEAERAHEVAVAQVRELQQALATARARQDAARARGSNLGSGADELRRTCDEAVAAHQAAVAVRDELEEAITALRRAQIEIDDRIAATRGRVGAIDQVRAAASQASEHRDTIEALARDHHRTGASAGAPDPTPVRLALAAIDAVCSARGGVHDPVANELAQAWQALRADLSAQDDPDAAEAAARDAAEAAHGLVTRLEALHAAQGPTPDDHRTIEAAHRERLEAAAAAQSRRPSETARLRLQDAEHTEQALLARFGFGSYAEYLIGSAGVGQAMAESPALLRARADLARAEAALIDAQARRTVWLDTVGAKREGLRARIAEHLGTDPGDDVLSELGTPRLVPSPPVELLFGLEVALADVGVADHGDDLLDTARRWLDAHAGSEQAELRFRREQAALAEERDEAIRRADEHEHELAAVAALDAELDHLATARAKADEQIEALVLKLATATEQERTAAAVADRAAEAARSIGADTTSIHRDTGDAEAEVAQLSAALDSAYRAEARAEVVLEERSRFRADLAASLALGAGDEPSADAGDTAPVTDLPDRIAAFFTGVAPLRWAGARPVIALDPFASLPSDRVGPMLDLLDAGAAQAGTEVWYRSDDPAVIAWARGGPSA